MEGTMEQGYLTLCFHEIRPYEEKGLSIQVQDEYEDRLPEVLTLSQDDFSLYLELLKEKHAYILNMDEVKSYHKGEFSLPKNSVLITFDDAFQSVKYNAYPLLKEYGYKALMFTVTGWLGAYKDSFNAHASQVMSEDELESLSDVFTLCNHTNSLHQRKGPQGKIQEVSYDALALDLDLCGSYVDEPLVFAYPFGFYDDSVVKNLESYGMELAYTTKPGINTKETSVLELNRYMATKDIGFLKDFLQ